MRTRAQHDDWYQQQRRKQIAALRERIEQDIALDAPFTAIKRDAAYAREDARAGETAGARRASAARTPALGLVSNETKGTPPVEKFQIDRDAKRIKRMRTGVQHAARLIDFELSGPGHPPMVRKFITLTYRDVDGWQAQDLSRFRRRLVEWCKRKGIAARGVWVGELQTRGAVHYHMVLWVPAWTHLPFFDRAGWWPHGSTNIKTAHSPIGYISKYASKTTADHACRYPKGARMFGAFGVDAEQRRHLRYWQAAFWVRDALTGRADIRKVRGGYADRITGEFIPSPWGVTITPDGRVFAFRKQETLQ